MSSKGIIIEEDNKEQDEIIRFMQDLEFVQCLANPFYLKYLSNMGYLDDEKFVNYLQYLLYFKKAEYMKFITYERCIIFLELLQYKEFRQKLKENEYEQYLNNFILKDWMERSVKIDNQNVNENIENNQEDKDNKINNFNDENIGMDIEN